MNWQQYLTENPQITISEIAEKTQGKPLEIVSTDDLEPNIDLLYQRGRDTGFSTGWPSLDVFYRIAPRYWTLVTGWPNMGKSAWVDNLAVNTMLKHGWRWLFFSAENQPYEAHWAGLAELYIGRPFNLGHPERMSPEFIAKSKEFLREHCWHIVPDDGMTVKRILDVSKQAVTRFGINCIVIDPWNELDHSRPYHTNETEYVSHALSKIRKFAREEAVHIFVVAHPQKYQKRDGALPVPTPHDVSGSSHFWNKADYAVCIYRDFADQTGETHVYVQKARHRWVAHLGRASLFYDAKTAVLKDPFTRMLKREPGEEG